MNTQALSPSSPPRNGTFGTSGANPTGHALPADKEQATPQTPFGIASRFFGPHVTPGTNPMTINSLPTPQLVNTYTPTVASVDIFARSPLHRPDVSFNSPPGREGSLQLTWDVENQLEFTLDPEFLQSSGDSIELPGGFPKKKESGTLPTTMPDSISLPRAQAPTPLTMNRAPIPSEHSPGSRSAFPPSAFLRRVPSQKSTGGTRPPSPMPSPLRSPPRLLPRSPVASLRNVELEHPQPIRPVHMDAVDDAGSIASLLADLPPPSPAASMAIGQGRPGAPSAIITSLNSAGFVVSSPFSQEGFAMGLQHGSPASQCMRAQLGCHETAGVSTIPFPTELDPPVYNRPRPVSKRGLTVGRGRPHGPTSQPSTPLYTPNIGFFPPSPFANYSPLPSAALQAPLPASPAADSFLDLREADAASLQAPSITSARLTEEQRAEHRVKWQALADRRAQAPRPPRSRPAQAEPVEPEWEPDFFEKYGLFGCAVPPPSRESSGDSFYQFLYDREACRSPERISGYVSPPPGQRVVCGLESMDRKGMLSVGSAVSRERRNHPSQKRIQRELRGTLNEANVNAQQAAVEDGDQRMQEWFVGTMLGRMGDIHSRMMEVDMRLQNVETVVAQPVRVQLPGQPQFEAPSAPVAPIADRYCVKLEHFGSHAMRRGHRVPPPYVGARYRWDQFFDLTNRLGRDFWFGGGDDAGSLNNCYLLPSRFHSFVGDFGASVTFDCRELLPGPEPLKFIIVEEVLDFMRQMLNAVGKLHVKGVYHGAIHGSNIGVHGSDMLKRQYVLFPCCRDEDFDSFADGQAQDMYSLGHIFMDLIVQSPIFKPFDDLADWMTGIGKPHQISALGAIWMFEDIVKKEEDLQQSYMTIYRPWCDSDDESSVSSATPSVYPNTSAGTTGEADSRTPTRASSGATSVTPIAPASRLELAEPLELGNAPANEVVVVDDTSFVMSPLAAEVVNLPPLLPRRSMAATVRKTWGKIKRRLVPRW
ncbi:hypothetical protein M407DRAFT_23246 [Tulasnella calospora MUT 4182]|uniref:Protein kinase domain-containing protein n=1 Tax=Tulasnella calospora MUT 4182 TaxID=1051891 RepID=A0A0C3QB01_9AGAM|nr:hypothetical protein M407DRAFT_23246 [Tulasnella calospora MUT 4182]